MILPQMSDSAVRTKNKKLHKQSHREVDPFALLLCHFLFLFYYTLFFRFEEFPINEQSVFDTLNSPDSSFMTMSFMRGKGFLFRFACT
jgi:hypothetical protein